MKKYIVLILSLFFIGLIPLNAQNDQTAYGNKYKDGAYSWHRNLSGASSNPVSYQDDGPNNYMFIKNDAGNLIEVRMQDDDTKAWATFLPDANGVSDYIRYYRSTTSNSNRCIYFNKKGMWIVSLSEESDPEDKYKRAGINAFIGNKAASGKNFLEDFRAYLMDSWAFQAVDKFEKKITTGRQKKWRPATTQKNGATLKSLTSRKILKQKILKQKMKNKK